MRGTLFEEVCFWIENERAFQQVCAEMPFLNKKEIMKC